MMAVPDCPPVLQHWLARPKPEVWSWALPNRYAAMADFAGDMQEGYRHNSRKGQDFTAASPGAWQPDWWVVAANYFADPFFVDMREAAQGLPVYFAFHGAARQEDAAALADWLEEHVDVRGHALWREVCQGLREAEA